MSDGRTQVMGGAGLFHLSIRQWTNLTEFKTNIKTWKGNECECQRTLYQNFVPFLGFI